MRASVSLGAVLAVLAAVLGLFLALGLLPLQANYVGVSLILLALARLS